MRPIINPPSTAPGSEPMPPSTAAVNAFTPGRKPSEKFTTPYCSTYIAPATAASAAPMTKVIEIVRSTSTPISAAILRSCSQARWARPRLVRCTSHQNTTSSTAVTTTMTI